MEHELPTQVDPAVVSWLSDGSEMGAAIRALDWSQTPIGPVTSWSPSLRMMVRFLLANRFPLLLWWGPQYISIYNDAYRPVLGTKHPWALGQPVSTCWSEIWHVLQPLIDTPFHGGPATWIEDLALEINRHGFVEETHFTVAYSPVPDETVPGGIGGVLATVHEISDKVVGERRVAVLRDLGARASEAKTAEDACAIAAATLAQHPQDIPFALLYLLEADGQRARLAGAAGVPMGAPASPLVIELTGDTGTGGVWPLAKAVRTEAMQIIDDLGTRCGAVPPGPWSDPPRVAAIVPIRSNMAHQLAALLVAGISVRLLFDGLYHSFLELVTTQIATSIANARAHEEERMRAEALATLDRAKTAFFSNVSHEFRTPLTLMLGPLEQALSAGDGVLDAPHRAELEVVHRNGLRLLKLVNTLLDFARLEAGRIEASYVPTDLAACTIDLASVFRSAIERAGLRLVVDCPLLPEAVYVDRDMWEKIVLNLLSNAFKFTFAGEIAVRLAWDGDHVALAVRDTGTGIPAHELPHIFERFHRIRDARARTHEGTGIGLALVQELVRLHGGQITVTSAVGVGTTCTVTIPTGTAHLPADRVGVAHTLASTALGADAYLQEALRWLPGEPESQSDGEVSLLHAPASALPSVPTRARILLADDNADMRAYVQRLLSPCWEVEAVADGAKALAVASERLPDLLLADVMMPGLDGFALLRALRADPRTATIPVLLLSARAGEEARVEGLEAGADDYLVKPFSARELLARVEAHLSLARLRREAAEQVRHSAEELAAVVHHSPAAIWIAHDAECRRITGNAAAAALLGLEPTANVPQRMPETVRRIYRRSGVALQLEELPLQRAIATAQPVHEPELELVRPDGTSIYLMGAAVPLFDAHGVVRGAVATLVDCTERKQADEALRAREATLRENQDHITRLNAQLRADLASMTRLQHVSTRLVQTGDFSALLHEILDAAIEMTDAAMGNIQLLDGDALKIVAQRGFDAPFLAFFNTVHDGLAACGTALQHGERVIIEDVAASPIFVGLPACDVMLAAQARAVQATPLITRSGRVLGVFSTHYRAPHRPAQHELRLLDVLARQAADCIERVQAEEALRTLNASLEQRVQEHTALLALIQDVTRAANEAPTSAVALQYALDRLCAYTGWPVGHVYLAVEPGAARWAPTALWHLDDPGRFAAFQQATQALEYGAGEDLIGRAGARGQPEWQLHLATDPAFQRRQAAQAAGLRTGVAWPLLVGQEVAGVLECYSTESLPPNPALLEAMTQIGTQLGRVIERERATEQAQRQQAGLLQREKLAAMSTMLANVAHELNNPLASIVLQAELLRDDVQGGPLAEPVAEITQAAARCERLVRQFLTLARQRPPERSVVALNTLVTETVELLAYPLRVDNVTVHLHLDAQLPPLWGDASQLQQVLLNLLTNAQQALRAAPATRAVTCTTQYDPAQQRIMLAVADTGPGIPVALQGRIFEPFFTTKPPAVGTGLGLPLCRGIVEAHGGTLEVSSAPGHGATFRLTLPVGTVPAATRAPVQADAGAQGRRCTILVVEDEPSLASGLARLLRRDGHSVDTVANGRLALAQLEMRAYDLLLCDVRMPELDGPSLYRLLERQQPQLCSRVIFLTGDTLEPATQAFLEASSAPCLLKPFAIAEARRVIQRTLQGTAPATPGTPLA